MLHQGGLDEGPFDHGRAGTYVQLETPICVPQRRVADPL